MVLTNRWAVLALLCFIRLVMGLQLQTASALSAFIVPQLGLDYTQLGMLVGLFMLPGIPLSIPSGLLGARFGDKAAIAAALALMTAGSVMFGASDGFALAFAGRLLAGAGSVVLMVLLPTVTTDWFAGREISTATGLLVSSWPVGIAAALALLPPLATALSWPVAVYATAASSAVAMVLFLALYRAPETHPSPASRRLWVITPIELRHLLGPSLLWLLTNMGFMVLMGFAPTLLVGQGFAVGEAGALVSLASLLPVLGYPVFGHLLDRSGRTGLFITCGTLASALPFLMLPLSGPAWFWLALFGLTYPAATVAIITLVTRVLSPASRSTGFGIFYAFCYLGMAAGPMLAGVVVDMSGRVDLSLWLGGLLWLMMLPTLLLTRFWLRPRRVALAGE
jgi:MFS family permease